MKRFLTVLILLALLLCACTTVPEETTVLTDTETVTEEVTETEPPETEPEETAVVHDAKLADGFTIQKMPTAKTTATKDSSTVKLKTMSFGVEYESTFYGPQSMVDRDSHHMGDLYVAANYCKEYPQDTGYFFGEFTGDRLSEYIIFSGGELKIYRGRGTYARYNDSKLLYTQNIELDGELRGTGDFNGDGYDDLLFITDKKTVFIGYGSENGFDLVSAGVLPGAENFGKEDFYSGDMNGDGLCDVIAVKGFDTASWTVVDGKTTLYSQKPLYIKDEYDCCCIGDINADGICDLVTAISGTGLRTYFGQKDGQFGPHENEVDNKNFCPLWEKQVPFKYMAVCDTNDDGVCDIVATMKLKASNKDYLICSLTYPTEAPAYDYSTSILKKDDGSYILYNGGLYVDYNNDKYNPTDGDHVLVYTSEDGKRWRRNIDAPAFIWAASSVNPANGGAATR